MTDDLEPTELPRGSILSLPATTPSRVRRSDDGIESEPHASGDEEPSAADITGLLTDWQNGDSDAGERLFNRLYPWLHRLAARQIQREGPGMSLQATELLHEAYLRLASRDRILWRSRNHFLAIGARVMRRLVVDHARHRHRQKRGGRAVRLRLQDVSLAAEPRIHPDILALDQALDRLARIDAIAARLVEVRYFGGLTVEEAAECLGVGRTTVVRSWQYARAWLRDALGEVPAVDRATRAKSGPA